jgi:hypothetical protein
LVNNWKTKDSAKNDGLGLIKIFSMDIGTFISRSLHEKRKAPEFVVFMPIGRKHLNNMVYLV